LNFVLGTYLCPDQDTFTIFGGYLGNELLRGVEWSKHVSFKNPIWQMVAMHHRCNISALLGAYICPRSNIFTKFSGYIDNGLPKCAEWYKYDSSENPIWRTAAMHHTYNIYRRSLLTSSTRSHFFTLKGVTSRHYNRRHHLSSYLSTETYVLD